MRKLFLLLSAMGLLVGLSQCTRPAVPEVGGGQVVTREVTITASRGDGSKVGFTDEEGALHLKWESTDEINVYEGSELAGTLKYKSGAGSTFAKFTGTITATVGQTLTFRVGLAPTTSTYTSQTGTLGWLKDYCCLEGTETCNEDGYYPNIEMTLPYAILKLDLHKLVSSTSEVTIEEGSSTKEGSTTVATVIDVANTPADLYVLIPVTGEPGDKKYTLSGSAGSAEETWNLSSNTIYTEDNGSGTGTGTGDPIVIEPSAPPVWESGDFTVYKNGGTVRKVKFSPGNLQYRASTDTWRFAEHQYDYVGDATDGNVYEGDVKCNNESISSTYTGWIDLFGWGTSGVTGYSPIANCVAPWSTSWTNSDYYAYGAVSKDLYDDATGYYPGRADWGYNDISNDGSLGAKSWRTLTTAEWGYLLNDRKVTVSDAPKASYGHGTVNGVNGLIILPDNWDGSVCSGFIYGDSEWSNTFSESTSPKWSEMESHGAVFLPAALYRDGTYVGFVHSIGDYWSSSYGSSHRAYNLAFGSGCVDPQDILDRCRGHSVRLVR